MKRLMIVSRRMKMWDEDESDRLSHAVEWGEMLKKAIERRIEVRLLLLRAEKVFGMKRRRLIMFDPFCMSAMQEMRRGRN